MRLKTRNVSFIFLYKRNKHLRWRKYFQIVSCRLDSASKENGFRSHKRTHLHSEEPGSSALIINTHGYTHSHSGRLLHRRDASYIFILSLFFTSCFSFIPMCLTVWSLFFSPQSNSVIRKLKNGTFDSCGFGNGLARSTPRSEDYSSLSGFGEMWSRSPVCMSLNDCVKCACTPVIVRQRLTD